MPLKPARRPFFANCVGWPEDLQMLEFLIEEGEEVSRDEFLRLVDKEILAGLERDLGYDRHLRMKDDYHVGYRVEPRTGIPFFVHSAIEFVFATNDEVDGLRDIVQDQINRESEVPMQNTKVSYLYRDGGNNKISRDVVIAGAMTSSQIAMFWEKCDREIDDHPSFVPGQIGLPDLQAGDEGKYPWIEDIDHPWHILQAIEHTDEEPTIRLSAEDLASELEEIEKVEGWDRDHRPEEDFNPRPELQI